jgi:hypothetical protein
LRATRVVSPRGKRCLSRKPITSCTQRRALGSVLLLLGCLAMAGCNGLSSANPQSSGTYGISGNITPAVQGSGATVTLSGAASATATADSYGTYRFTGLSNGAYKVSPSRTGYSFSPSAQAATVNSATLTGVNFVSSTSSPTFSISGTISPAADGGGATVTLSGDAIATIVADSSGKYTFAGVSAGSYVVSPSKTGFSFSPTSQTTPVTAADVTGVNFVSASSSQTFSISGTISPAANGSGATVTLGGAASATATADSAGAYSFTGLSNGSYTVSLSKSGFSFGPSSRSATVQDANVAGLDFTGDSCSSGASADFYVATTGNDSWSGTLECPGSSGTDGPFATIARAQQAVRAILQNPQGRTATIAVMIRSGVYYQAQPLSFGAADSGTSALPVSWQNYPNETPLVSGGMLVKNWVNVGGNQWQTNLPTSARYFEQLFYNGSRRLRPQLGASGTDNLGTYYRVAATIYLKGSAPPSPAPDPNCSLYVAGSGWQCFDRFQYKLADPVTDTWQNLAPPVGNPCGQPAGNPQLVGDIELVDFEFYTVPKLRISCVDTATQMIYFTGPTAIVPNTPTAHGFITDHRYVIENVKDELSQPGQWFLDRSNPDWVLTYLAESGENPNVDAVVIPQASQVLVAAGLRYVTFQGITFAHDNFVVPAGGYDSLQQDYFLSPAVSCQNCKNVTFDSDTVTETSGGGLEFVTCIGASLPLGCVSPSNSGSTMNNVIQNSAFYDIGGMAIRIGVPPLQSDTDSSVPQFTTVQNNVVEGYGRVFPSAFGIVQGDGHDNTYTHNDIHHGYHAAISICSNGCAPGLANSHGAFNNTISFNHVHDLMQGIMDDGGALYFMIGGPTFTATGNKMLNNRVHDISDASALDADGYGGEGLYLDAQSGLVDVENNLVYRVSAVPMFITEAPPAAQQAHTIKNNIFAFGRMGMISNGNPYPTNSCKDAVTVFNATNNIFYFDRNRYDNFKVQRGCTYSCGMTYPQFQNWQSNLYWRTDGAFASDPFAFHVQSNPSKPDLCDSNMANWTFYTFAQWRGTQEDTQSVVQDPGFANPTYPADDYSLTSSPGAGFVVFDPTEAGRSTPVINPPAVADTFITTPLNPATDF